MGYLPIFIDLRGRTCVVIGGGPQAEAKIRVLLEAGACVTVIGPELADITKWPSTLGQIHYVGREYEYGDLRGSSLGYVVTADTQVAATAAREARELGIPLNVIDNPELSTFISPAVVTRGDLQIAISTSGSSPAVARMLRQQFEREIGAGYGHVLEIMRGARHFLRSRVPDQLTRAGVLTALGRALMDSVEALDYQVIDLTLRKYIGAGIADLGLDIPGLTPSADTSAHKTGQ